MTTVSPEQEHINRQLMALGQAMRGDDEAETMRLVFNLAADTMGNLARCATALERIAVALEPQKMEIDRERLDRAAGG